jgi:hypothetical protein
MSSRLGGSLLGDLCLARRTASDSLSDSLEMNAKRESNCQNKSFQIDSVPTSLLADFPSPKPVQFQHSPQTREEKEKEQAIHSTCSLGFASIGATGLG